jgi:two-component system CheB/CheR fusion protein
MTDNLDEPRFEDLLDYLRNNRGFDFTGYKCSSLHRRVTKRKQEVGIDSFNDYQDYLEVHPEEFALLFNTILINVTSFFRDPGAWEYIAEEVIPAILASKPSGGPVRVWTAGCASGEEAYTVAMLLCEALGDAAYCARAKIYATDVDEEALTHARHASYTAKDLDAVPEPLRNKCFEMAGGRYVFRADLRRSIVFGRHDLVQDAPISRMDLAICRNTLMYFNAETQGRILSRLHFAPNDGGFLFLGKAEMLLLHAKHFKPADMRHRVFAKIPVPARAEPLLTPSDVGNGVTLAPAPPDSRLRDLAFDAMPVAQIVLDAGLHMVMANVPARNLFGLAPQDIGRRLQDLELSYRPVELRSLIDRAGREQRPITVTDVERAVPNGKTQFLEVVVAPIQKNDSKEMGVTIAFREVTQVHELREQLVRSNQNRETANEELETTNEELQSTVEELQTTNEELQSTNEEMETMNEELQSTNDELQTMNARLRSQTVELDEANSFLRSVLGSIHVGVVAVDNDLTVFFWNDEATNLWGVRADEAIGRSLPTLDIGLPVSEIKAPVQTLLAGKGDRQEVLVDAINRRGKPIRCRIITWTLRIGPTGTRHGAVLMMEEMRE